jgi:YD repeat-containing protein
MARNGSAARVLLVCAASLTLLSSGAGLAAESVGYTYDALGRLSTVTYGNGEVITYVYDAAGNRRQLVQSPPALPNATLTANPAVIASGGTSTLTWSTARATSATMNNGIGPVSLDGGTMQVTLTATTTYSLAATGPGGTTTAFATVFVDTTPPSTPTITSSVFQADFTVRLSWTQSSDLGGSTVAGYEISKGCPLGNVIASTTVLTYTTPPQEPGRTCDYQVRAFDAVGNRSAWSSPATVISPQVQFSIANTSANENATFAKFTVTRSGGSGLTNSVNYLTGNGSAAGGQDFIAATGTITFNPGETSKTVDIQLLNDVVYEGNETFTVTLFSPSGGATITTGTATATILEDDPSATVNIESMDIFQGAFGAAQAFYALTTSGDIVTSGPTYLSSQDVGDWVTPKTAVGNFEAFASGDGMNCGGPLNQWIDLGSRPAGWEVHVTGIEQQGYCNLQVKIRAKANPGVILDTAGITISAFSF